MTRFFRKRPQLMHLLMPWCLLFLTVGIARVLEWGWPTLVTLGIVGDPGDIETLPFADFTIVLGLFACGAYRAMFFNPACRADYREWLVSTPWTPDKPLPLGPVRLTVVDWACVILLAIMMGGEHRYMLAPMAFIASYGWLIGRLNFASGQDFLAGLTVALAALIPYLALRSILSESALPIGSCLVVIAILLALGWNRTLSLFPWYGLPRWKQASFSNKNAFVENPLRGTISPRVHPWDSLSGETAVNYKKVLGEASLLGWIVASLLLAFMLIIDRDGILEAQEIQEMLVLIKSAIPLTFGVIFAIVRFLCYRHRCGSPLSWWARLRTGRWLILDYDRIYVTPIITMLVGITLSLLLPKLTLSLPTVGFLGTVIPMAVALGLSPSIEQWRLTGGFRMSTSPPSLSSRNESSTPSAANRS